ncbi:MAG: M43 family zinc metalloprotease, partial [Bacteroidota bacterium]
REEFENWLSPKIAQQKAQRSANGTNAVITIPVVVHVIHNGDAYGSNENITDEQVMSQITVLNQDYRRMVDTPGYNENPVGADTEIEFCLAKVDPDGNATNGIDRVNLGQASWSSINAIDDGVKPDTSWNPSKYMNIWVVNYGNSSDLLGYAQFPSSNAVPGNPANAGFANTDGVVIGYKFFGSADIYPQGTYDASNTYIYGRTATHEVGHFLGLIHIWGDNSSCIVNATDSNKDYCPDTPAASTEHYICQAANSCISSPGNDMVENYMDYTNDACMNVFTQDQKERMVAILNNATRRKSLTTSTVCQPTAGTEDYNLLNGMSIYPNPAQTVLNINSANGDLPDSYIIYNNLGQTIASVKVSSNANLTINTSAYANGIYFIKIDKGAQTKTLKFVKN